MRLIFFVAGVAGVVGVVGVAGGQTPVNVTGRVVNATTGVPVARALVNLNSRAVLTDSMGKFDFPQFLPNSKQTGTSTAPQAYVKVTKPGYSAALDMMEALDQQPVMDVTKPLELLLYPDALITGLVTGSDRQPLAKVNVTLYREFGDEAQRRMMPVATAQTDSHGEYRFDEGAGRYVLLVRYSARSGETGEAVLPQRYPENNGSNTSTTFPVNPGEERKVDLQVKTGLAYPVIFQADGGSDGVRNVRVGVKIAGGGSFMTFAQPGQSPGEFRIDLPSGSYQLLAMEQTRDHRMEADGHVTVTGRAVTGLTMHFGDLPTIPIQVIIDPAGTTTSSTGTNVSGVITLPTAQSLNLYLKATEGSVIDGAQDEVRVMRLPDKSFALQPGMGTYRLASQTGGQWFVQRASYGTTDLLTQNLTVAAGSGTDVIRVVVSNAMGQVAGTVRQGGAAVFGRGYVYLIPTNPGLTPVFTTQISQDGTYQTTVPPGSYTILAFDHRFPGDLRSPEVTTKLPGGGTITVTAGARGSLDLELQRVEAIQ